MRNRRCRKIFENNIGMGLIEVLVATAILSVASIFVVDTFVLQKKTVAREWQTYYSDSITADISEIMSDFGSCIENLSGANPAGVSGTNLTQIRIKDQSGANFVKYEVSKTYGANSVVLQSINIANYIATVAADDGTAEVTLTFTRPGGVSILRSFLVDVKLTAGVISSCRTDRNAFVEAACSSLGGTVVGMNCVNLNITGTLSTNGNLRAGTKITGTSIAAARAQSTGGMSVAGTFQSAGNISISGAITAGDLLASSLVKASRISTAEPSICINANCRNFAPDSCAVGFYASGVNSNGTLICNVIPPPPPPPPPPGP